MTPAGLEPAIPGSVGRCLIHWATGPLVDSMQNVQDAKARRCATVEQGKCATSFFAICSQHHHGLCGAALRQKKRGKKAGDVYDECKSRICACRSWSYDGGSLRRFRSKTPRANSNLGQAWPWFIPMLENGGRVSNSQPLRSPFLYDLQTPIRDLKFDVGAAAYPVAPRRCAAQTIMMLAANDENDVANCVNVAW